MKIAICGSISFSQKMIDIKNDLEKVGHTVEIPEGVEKYAAGVIKVEDKWQKNEHDYVREWHKVICESDAVLILNYDKNGIKNYIGGNSLIEMAFAHVNFKKIFLMNDIPSQNYSDEVESFGPVILNGDLSLIK